MPPSDVCFCVYKSGNHNTMDQGTLKELNKRSSQQEWKKRQKKKRLRIWTETERKVKKIKIKLNNCALRIPRALFFPITLALASAVPFVQFRYLLFLVFFRFDFEYILQRWLVIPFAHIQGVSQVHLKKPR